MNHLKKLIFHGIVIALVVTACKDETEQLQLQRMFKPSGFDITRGETSAVIAWNPSLFTIPGKVEYVIEISRHATDFGDPEVIRTSATSEITVLDTEIDIKTDYYARVKALGTNGADDSNWLMSEAFQITGQIFILPVREYDVITDAVRINWEVEDVLTKIVLTPHGEAPIEVPLTAEEAAAGEKIISGLTPNTNYKAEIFKGDVGKGDVTFRTKDAYATSNVVDLRKFTNRPKVLGDTLQQIPSGSVVLLKRGLNYTIDATDPTTSRTFDRSVTIVSGPDFVEQLATIRMTTNFNIVAGSVIDSIVFRDVNIKGSRANGLSFDSDYVLNVNQVGTLKNVKLENCRISRLRGTVRLQTGTTGARIENYRINNCVIDSIREFAIVMASAASSFQNVLISNSTFTRCRRYVDHRVTGNNSLRIENCTFNEVPSGSLSTLTAPTNYLIDFNTFGSASPVVITNCIIGSTWAEVTGSTDAGGIRATGTTVNVINTYTLSDFVSGNATYQLPGVSAYPGTSTSVFMDPAGEDFRIKDQAFPGATSAGDPRWRQ